uniref:Uncharacterized protein n=1 Tax=Hyaloperonospora arabidopsidis (strain Emoy2) TaxID=559515 RepID=M4C0C0_HYAAE
MEHSRESSDDEFLSAVLSSSVCRTGCRAVGRRETRWLNARSSRQQGSQPRTENPTYNAVDFRRQFRMSRQLFLCIMDTVQQFYNYFAHKPDATGQMGFSVPHNCTSSMRQLTYGDLPDSLNESLRMAESNGRECLLRFSQQLCKHLASVICVSRMRKKCNVY